MKKYIFCCLAFFTLCGNSLFAQSFITMDDHLVNGYASKLSGTDFEYTSCIPGFKASMLLRATNGKDFME